MEQSVLSITTPRKCLTKHKAFLHTIMTIALLFILASCEKKEDDKDMRPELNFKSLQFTDIDGWENDQHYKALKAFKTSCESISRSTRQGFLDKDDQRFGKVESWKNICNALEEANITDDQDARLFFETYFMPYQVLSNDQADGLFTGYYVASLNGSDQKTERYRYPVYKKPDDLVMVDLGHFRDDLKGRRIAGTVKNGRLFPYKDRQEIEDQGLDVEILLYADDPVDVFFLHIQGSGRVKMADGSYRFLGYAGQNGHPYKAIGKFLIENEEIAREDMSMQAIREWLINNPEKRDDLLNKNPSYVFFRELENDGAIGGQGVVLSPERSLAVDHTYYPYGVPMWLDAEHPLQQGHAIKQLMVAQDTGGAIRGPVRGDFFWGYGAEAEKLAGPMKSKGQMIALLPINESMD